VRTRGLGAHQLQPDFQEVLPLVNTLEVWDLARGRCLKQLDGGIHPLVPFDL
jgi:hypothetical protein